MTDTNAEIIVVPFTGERWADFETIMGPNGGYGGCWCMLWRQSKAEYDANAGGGNRDAMKELAAGDRPPGLLAYAGDEPVGWLSVAPRADFPRLENSRVLQPVDDADVWSVSCFLIAKGFRRKGVALRLLEAACDFVADQGGTVIEGYPIAPKKTSYSAAYAWTGFATVFERAGFTEVLRRSATRPIMRKTLGEA